MEQERKGRTVLRKAAGIVGAITGLATLLVAVVSFLVWTGTAQWQEVVGFVDWFSGATSFGAILVGASALIAARWAYRGVQDTVRSAEQRERETREAVDTRERETARHARFTTIVGQLASAEDTVRLGGMFALSALADEWEREARRLIRDSPEAFLWEEWGSTLREAVDDLSALRQGTIEQVDGTPVASGALSNEWKQQIAAAERALWDARMQYALTRESAPLSAKDAVSQRDACRSLITAYLRTDPLADIQPNPGSAPDGQHPSSPDADEETHIVPITLGGGDISVRSTAVEILRDHTADEAIYPWPSQQIDLSGAHLEGVDLRGRHLEGAHLDGTHLELAYLDAAHLESADLHGAHLMGARLDGAHLGDANLDEADLFGAHMDTAELSGASLVEANLHGATLKWSQLQGADLEHADLEEADLVGAHLEDARLPYANLRSARPHGANMDGADLSGAILRNADLTEAVLRGASMQGVDLQDAKMVGTNLEGVFLYEADLRGARLRAVNLRSAVLTDAVLNGVDLSRTDLGTKEAGNLCKLAVVRFDGTQALAHWDDTTVWPADFAPDIVAEEQLRID